jgi:hypothetical protein
LRRAHDHVAGVVRRLSNMLHATGAKHRFESGFCYDSGSLIHGPRCKRRIQANLENCKFRHLARLVTHLALNWQCPMLDVRLMDLPAATGSSRPKFAKSAGHLSLWLVVS